MLSGLLKSTFLLRVLTGLFTLLSFSLSASNNYWQPTQNSVSESQVSGNKKTLTAFKLYHLDVNNLKTALSGAPMRGSSSSSITVVEFPDADGNLKSYHAYEFSNMEPALAAAFPEIKSYVGKGSDDPTSLIYFSVSPLGLQTMLLRADQPTIIIEPYTTDRSVYAVYRKGDKSGLTGSFDCTTLETLSEKAPSLQHSALRPNADDGNYRTYRLALSCTGEYTAFFGGTKALALAAMNNSMTRVNGVFEVDFGVHMNIIANDTVIIYTNAATDPYSNASSGAAGAWNQQLQTTLTTNITNANYDIGHLFGASGGGGNAGCIACVCVNPSGAMPLAKGSGFTSPADAIPMGDNFDIDYVAHEMGHQFGGNHTFTFGNEGTIAQVEPGSGSTIMGYAGITGSTDVQPHSDAYFAAVSIQQITNYVKATSCQVTTVTGNAVPTANAGLDYTIPRGTPFALTGTATDANDVNLSYCWEQMDVGSPSTTFPSVSATTGVAFRSFTPTSSPTRLFPRLATIQAGLTSWTWEAVPNNARSMNFRFTVRDNHAGGPANNSDDMVVTVTTTSGPFTVSAPNTAVSWAGGSIQNIIWNVASTTAAPVSCANVKISLSTDGGVTFPTILTASTANDGSESVTIPNVASTTARIKVEAVGNIFFDMSNTNFTITAGATLTTITTGTISPLSYCAGTAVSVPFTTNAAANAGNIFTAQLSNSTGSFASPVNIGTLSSTGAGTISATIPAGTATGSGYRIRVVSSNPSVTGSANTSNITINTKPVPVITGGTFVCTGVNANLDAGSGYSAYLWSTGATTQVINVASAGTYTVTVTNAGGCTGADSHGVQQVNVIVNITGNTTFCAGSSTTLDAGAGYDDYLWSTGATTQAINVNAAGVYTVSVWTPAGCFAATSVNVTQSPSPNVLIIGTTTICAGSSTTLSTAAFSSYLWSTGATSQSINVSPAINTTYTVTVSNASGCTNSTSANVTVNPLPAVSFTGLAANYAAGAPNATLTGNPAGGTFSGPGITGNVFSPSAAGTGMKTITYTYTNANNCTNSSSQQTTVGSCTLPARPGSIATAGGAVKVCPGDVKNYSVGTVAGATSYTWTAPTGGTVTAGQGTNAVTVTYNAGFTANGSLSVVANNACGSGLSRALTIQRNTPGTPSAITGTTAGLCNQSGVPYSVTNVAGMTHNWTFSVAAPSVAGGQGTNAITANYAGLTGSASLRVTASNGCGTSATRSLTVKAPPATPAAITGSTTVCANQQAVPYSIAPLANVTNYTWSVPTGARINDGAVTSTATTLTTTATAVTVNFATTAGNVRARGNNACGAGSYLSKAVTITCREAALVKAEGFNMHCYPVPADKIITVFFNSEDVTSTTIRITDIIGKTQMQLNEVAQQGKNEMLVDIASLSSGIYMLTVTNGNDKAIQRIVIE